MPDIFQDTDEIQPELESTGKLSEKEERQITPPPKPKQKHEVGILETFCEYPAGIAFQHQEKDEEIILFLRQHLITNVPWAFIATLLFLAPFIVVPLFRFTTILPFDISNDLLIVLLLFYFLIVFAYIFVNFLHWFYNIGIVTDKRVVDVDYSNIVYVHVSATKVLQIQDVTYTQTGFFRTLFNFGDIFIQTAGQHPNFEFLRVPNPSKATFIIQKLIGLA